MAFPPGRTPKYLKKKKCLPVNLWMNAYKRTNGPHRAPRAESSKVCPKEQDSNHLERAACKENMSKLAPLSFVQRHL